MLDEGVYTSVSEIGDTENTPKSYVSRILRLALLAPDLVETILAGNADPALMLEKLERPLPTAWNEQRRVASPMTQRRRYRVLRQRCKRRLTPV
jgi:hypothetical protein